MTDKPTIFEALSGVMADIGAVGKDQRNQQQGFNFRGVDQAMNAAHPALVKHGVLVLPVVEERLAETRKTAKGGELNVVHLCIRYRFFGPAGDSVEAVVWGEAMDSADKATNKAMATAFKYALFQVLCIPTEEMRDTDQSQVEAASSARPAQSRPAASDERADEINRAKRRVWTLGTKLGMDRDTLGAEFNSFTDGGVLSSAGLLQLQTFGDDLERQAKASNGSVPA